MKEIGKKFGTTCEMTDLSIKCKDKKSCVCPSHKKKNFKKRFAKDPPQKFYPKKFKKIK